MPKLSAAVLGCLLPIFTAQHALAQSSHVVVGVNLIDTVPPKQSESWQEATLTTLQDAGVRVIRSAITNDDRGVGFARRAFAHNVRLAWLVPVASPAGNMILSSADPEKFRAYFQPLLAKLESSGIALAGIELGKEINWSNHDLGAIGAGTGRVFKMDDLLHDPKGQQVAKGYRNYVRVLAVLKDVRDHSKLNRSTPIIIAGMGAVSPAFARQAKRDAVSLDASIQFLRVNGADKLADAYGIHWYPDGSDSPADRFTYLAESLSECSTQKPCWITEWGLPVSSGKSCPVVDVKRTAIFSESRDDFRQFAQQGRLKGLLFYTWEGGIQQNGVADNNPYGAFICGSLTRSGWLAIEPL
jgi:hypothetical protein